MQGAFVDEQEKSGGVNAWVLVCHWALCLGRGRSGAPPTAAQTKCLFAHRIGGPTLRQSADELRKTCLALPTFEPVSLRKHCRARVIRFIDIRTSFVEPPV